MERQKMIRNNTLLIVSILLGLSGCNRDFSDLQAYISSVKARPGQPVKSLPEFKTVEPFVLKKDNFQRDPFKPVEKIKVADEVSEEQQEPDNGIHPDLNRKKEPLEAFPLSSVQMVGTINMNSVLWGLLKNENTIYRVKVGHYLGKNDGRIVKIEKNKIEIIEIAQTKPGRFIEQSATIVLNE
jgi:type IV pilus assembly protein PilP